MTETTERPPPVEVPPAGWVCAHGFGPFATRDEAEASCETTCETGPARRDVPAGKVLLAEYGDFGDDERAVRTKLAERATKRRTYLLVHSTPGFESAGAVARWTNGYFAVWFFDSDGARNGRQFKTEAEARALFDLWTKEEE